LLGHAEHILNGVGIVGRDVITNAVARVPDKSKISSSS
jgi:hypothetical protein